MSATDEADRHAEDTPEAPRISVVIPTYGRPALLARCLDALVRQSLPPEQYEIVVADNAEDTNTERLVEAFGCAGGPALHYVAAGDVPGPAAARNRGWRRAAAPIIAFTDDDCVPEPDWLEQGLVVFADRCVAAAGGTIRVPIPERPTDYQRNTAELQHASFATANCFCRRAWLAAVGGFDERFRTAWREDSDLEFTLCDNGARLVAAHRAVVVHPVRAAPWGVSVLEQRKSMYNALLYKKHPARYRHAIQAAPPWHYYRIVTTLIVGIAAALRGRYSLAAVSGSAWALMTAQFCCRRLQGTARTPTHIAEMGVTSVLIPPLCVFWRLRGAITFRVMFL